MRLSVARVERLLEADADRRCVGALVQAELATALLRQLLVDRQRHEPTLTVAELARRMGTSQVQVERWLGLRATAPKTDRRGRTYPGAGAGARERRDRRAVGARDRLRPVRGRRMLSHGARPARGRARRRRRRRVRGPPRASGSRDGFRRCGQAPGGRLPMICLRRAWRRTRSGTEG